MVEPSPAPPKYMTLELGWSEILTSRKESEEEDDQAQVDSTAADSILNDIGPLLSDNERERIEASVIRQVWLLEEIGQAS